MMENEFTIKNILDWDGHKTTQVMLEALKLQMQVRVVASYFTKLLELVEELLERESTKNRS